MKLYEIYRGDKFYLKDEATTNVAPASRSGTDQPYKLLNLDGMYSRCKGEYDGEVYYFNACTEIVLIEEEEWL